MIPLDDEVRRAERNALVRVLPASSADELLVGYWQGSEWKYRKFTAPNPCQENPVTLTADPLNSYWRRYLSEMQEFRDRTRSAGRANTMGWADDQAGYTASSLAVALEHLDALAPPVAAMLAGPYDEMADELAAARNREELARQEIADLELLAADFAWWLAVQMDQITDYAEQRVRQIQVLEEAHLAIIDAKSGTNLRDISREAIAALLDAEETP